jgi:UBX domain-containing protein 6
MAAIKKFFEKRKLNMKFKLAGEGHRLDSTSSSALPQRPEVAPIVRSPETLEQQKLAAEAALARMNQQQKVGIGSSANRGSTSLRSQIRQDMEAEKKAAEKAASLAARYAPPREVALEAAPVVGQVLYRCPLVGEDVVLPKDEMESYIEAFLMSQLSEEPAMTAALMIYTLNRTKAEAVKQCVETVSKYLENIISNPTEEKYRRIRASNKVLIEKVLSVKGAEEFLQAAGFVRKRIAGPDGSPDEFLVLQVEGDVDMAQLTEMREILLSAEPIRPELDRGIRVYHYAPSAANMAVPDEFFRISADEIRREQQTRAEAVEQFGMLRTRQMRERDRLRELRRYRYCLIRVRLPDSVLLQGTFHASEKLSILCTFIRDCLIFDFIPFVISTSSGQRLIEENLSLAELDLCPASLVNLSFDPEVLKDVAASRGGKFEGPYLKPELMSAITSL